MSSSLESVWLNKDDLSPFQLQSGDSQGSILVFALLMGDNYRSWCRSMEMTLQVKNKISFITGAISQLNASNPLFSA